MGSFPIGHAGTRALLSLDAPSQELCYGELTVLLQESQAFNTTF